MRKRHARSDTITTGVKNCRAGHYICPRGSFSTHPIMRVYLFIRFKIYFVYFFIICDAIYRYLDLTDMLFSAHWLVFCDGAYRRICIRPAQRQFLRRNPRRTRRY